MATQQQQIQQQQQQMQQQISTQQQQQQNPPIKQEVRIPFRLFCENKKKIRFWILNVVAHFLIEVYQIFFL